ncbi:hypothetical protein HO173_010045 [Letharia columbiana]|uniref:Uncharacterized protein n=1 Tax=Letharia columbiana TaxID=112416 RepID=A0A8H6FNE2_9LECA|nr:uncharacterized protein HO173_010045 [Letharia columbiana]KAF6231743.1 hypothetical protein HO173_010045 [Letharia columbiana]
MDHLAEMHELPVPAQDPSGRFQYLSVILVLCFWFGLIDWQLLLFGLLILYINLSPVVVHSPEFDITVAVPSGKYIPKEVTTRTDAPRDIRQRPVLALEQGPNKSLAMVPCQRPALQGQSTTRSKVPEHASSSKKQMAVVLRPRNAVSKVQDSYRNTASLKLLGKVEVVSSSIMGQAGQVTAATDENRLENADDDQRAPVGSQSVEEPTGVQKPIEAEEKIVLQLEPDTFEKPTDGHTVPEEGAGSAPTETTAKQIGSAGVVSASKDQSTTTSIVRDSGRARNSRIRRLAKPCVARSRTPGLERSVLGRVRSLRLKMMAKRAKTVQRLANQQGVADGIVDVDGGMTGLEVVEQAEVQIRGRVSVGAQTSQQTGTGSAVDRLEVGESMEVSPSQHVAEDSVVDVDQAMTDPEVEEKDEDGDVKLVDADTAESQEAEQFDEVMIGSDVEAEMEVDDEAADSVGEPMDLEEDNPQLEAKEAGIPDPMHIEPQYNLGMVDKEKLQDKIRREKAEIALRQTSTNGANSGEMGSASGGALAQSSQQHAAPVSTPPTGNAATSILQGVAQNLTSTNSAADLRSARLGKRPESRPISERVAGPSPSPGRLVTENRGKRESTQSILPLVLAPPSTSSSEKQVTEDGDTSESVQSITTPASTSPSTASSTPPTSRNVASSKGPSKPAGVKTEESASKEQNCKRGCNFLRDSSNDEKLGDEAEKPKAIQGDQSMPGSASPKVSPPRRILAKPVRRMRKVQTADAKVSEAEDDRKMSASRTAPAPQPTEDAPAESSKKARSGPTDDGASDQEVAPLNDIPDDRGQLEYTSQVLEVAAAKWDEEGHSDADDDDDD